MWVADITAVEGRRFTVSGVNRCLKMIYHYNTDILHDFRHRAAAIYEALPKLFPTYFPHIRT